MKKSVFIQLDDETAIKTDEIQWMICNWKSGRWVPTSFHTSVSRLSAAVLDRKLRFSEGKCIEQLIDALSRENQKLVDAITGRLKNADSE